MSFASLLTKRVTEKKQEQLGRESLVDKWIELESRLLDKAVELFKQRCVREAEQLRCELSVSFEVLTRDVPEFPTRVFQDSSWVVGSWGESITPECWWYASHGLAASWSPGAPILFAEVLAGMIPKFMERIEPLGFQSCVREEGTWQVKVAWRVPNDDEVPDSLPALPAQERPAAPKPAEKRPPSHSRTLSASCSRSPSRGRNGNNGKKRRR